MPSGLSLPCRSAQHPLGHHLLSLVTPIASSGLDPEDIAHSEVPVVVGQRCPTCPCRHSLHIPHPAWCGQCPPAPSSLGWPMQSPAGNWGGGGGEEGLVSPSPFSASTTPAHLPSGWGGNSSATSPRGGGYPVGSPTRHLCLEQPLHLPPGINLSRVPHHCLAGTLTDQGNKQKRCFVGGTCHGGAAAGLLREGGGVCLWGNHSRGGGQGTGSQPVVQL